MKTVSLFKSRTYPGALGRSLGFAFAVLLTVRVTAAPGETNAIKMADGVVQPMRPMAVSVADAMQFLKKADGGYVPGSIAGELAGYFTSAHVNPDGTRASRQLAYPARQHAYFIFTFLRYYAYTGEPEWRLRARDLADWNIAHSTPTNAAYAGVPYSTFVNGKPGGARDKDSIEPDKIAFLGSGYIAIYEATGERKYLDAALTIARMLAKHQRADGSWPFRVVPESGIIRQDFGGAPVFFVEFFENILRHQTQPEWQRVHDLALKLMLDRNIVKNLWGTYHEDIGVKPEAYPSAEPMSFTADYLFRKAAQRAEFLEMGRAVIRSMEDRLVFTNGHAAAPAPAVSEQAGFQHLMPGHTARYCRALADLYALTGEEAVKRRALSGFNAVTYMQSAPGLFRTFFASVNPKADTSNRPDWYSQHLYTVCHILEASSVLPELVPTTEDHLLDSQVFLRAIRYQADFITYETMTPARTVVRLNVAPKTVEHGQRPLPSLKQLTTNTKSGWSYDSRTRLLTIQHEAGAVRIHKGTGN